MHYDIRHDDHIWDNVLKVYVLVVNDESKAQEVADRLNASTTPLSLIEELKSNGEGWNND